MRDGLTLGNFRVFNPSSRIRNVQALAYSQVLQLRIAGLRATEQSGVLQSCSMQGRTCMADANADVEFDRLRSTCLHRCLRRTNGVRDSRPRGSAL